MSDHGKILPIKIEFSERGGHSYSQTSAYHYYLRQQQQGDKIYLKKREPVTEMLNWDLMKEFPHGQRAGLQLADYVASAFYQAIDFLGPGLWDTRPAERLYPIIASENGSRKDFGVTLFPSRWWEAKLTPEQEKIFRFYGYEFVRW